MKKVFKILNLLSVVAMSCVLICCSGGGSSSDDEDVAVESTPETPAVSTAETPTVTTPETPAVSTTETPTVSTPTTYLARCEYTDTPGDHLINEYEAENGYIIEAGRAVPYFENTIVSRISGLTYLVTAEHGYYLESTNPIVACELPDGIIGSEIDPVTNCWVR